MRGDAGPVEAEEDRLRLDAGHAEADEVGEPAGAGVAVDHHAVETGGRTQDAVGETPLLGRLLLQLAGAVSSSAAAPKPTIAGTFSIPARRARS